MEVTTNSYYQFSVLSRFPVHECFKDGVFSFKNVTRVNDAIICNDNQMMSSGSEVVNMLLVSSTSVLPPKVLCSCIEQVHHVFNTMLLLSSSPILLSFPQTSSKSKQDPAINKLLPTSKAQTSIQLRLSHYNSEVTNRHKTLSKVLNLSNITNTIIMNYLRIKIIRVSKPDQ